MGYVPAHQVALGLPVSSQIKVLVTERVLHNMTEVVFVMLDLIMISCVVAVSPITTDRIVSFVIKLSSALIEALAIP